ncbi:1-phosphatidylinositol 4,5-bisphosphate phosphodiesterase gamma-1-like isoform X2 [Apostichopus japonicus]|uniref:1-phosphatidylinositol 4,5-bisphosphate phosphodiesterase gamma-1-like isoform X2 n=1 Tax=Stichopus japonicus TaxID=307972 RepID=UPI003AB7C524
MARRNVYHSNGHNGTRYSAEDIPRVKLDLKLGTVLTRFFAKKRPEKRSFEVEFESRQVLWRRQAGRTEGAISIGSIKEIRKGTNYKHFEKWPDEVKKIDQDLALIIFYGSEFRLKTLSVVAANKDEFNLWYYGLQWLLEDTGRANHPLELERWMKREFFSFGKTTEDKITLREMKSILPRMNLKMNIKDLRDAFNEVSKSVRQDLTMNEFIKLYHNLLRQPSVTKRFVDYMDEESRISLEFFTKFLKNEQNDVLAKDKMAVEQYIRKYFEESASAPDKRHQVYFTGDEFVDYLYSKDNELWDRTYDEVTDTMDQPICNYWIASSHNTYLTGDQVSSESSCEAYVRCLRMGCRCIELDCWDGPDGLPYIYHGHTLTTKIKFLDVLNTIKEHAFATTDFPIVLSIENHCTLTQQRNMAHYFQTIFGDALLTQPIKRDATTLPSVNELKGKIMIKHKKLPDRNSEVFTIRVEEATERDVSDAIKSGRLLLRDIDQEWKPHYCVLTEQRLLFSPVSDNIDNNDDDDDTSQLGNNATPDDELHFSEPWFHGKIEKVGDLQPRVVAEELLTKYQKGDGTFLVRDSDTFKGDYTLSFWAQGRGNHCRIKSKLERGQPKYFLVEHNSYDSLYSLINHYRQVPLRSRDLEVRLTEPVPQPQVHEKQEWFHSKLSRNQAEDMLTRIHRDGAYLVRKSERESDAFAISFRAEGKIKHCRIKQEGRLFTIGNAQFESLTKLVEHYGKHALYRKMKLKYPVSEEMVNREGQNPDAAAIYDANPELYMDPNQFVPKVCVKALYDYRAQRDDELSFCKHAIIYNVDKQDHAWWKGDYGSKIQMWFPANYVEECIEPRSEYTGPNQQTSLESEQKGTVDIGGCTVEMVMQQRSRQAFVFRIVEPQEKGPRPTIELASESAEDMEEWCQCIQHAAVKAEEIMIDQKAKERKLRIAKEFSDLVVYFRTVPFTEDIPARKYYEMSSFPETKVERFLFPGKSKILKMYNSHQVSRTYPKGQRIDSSNYDPVPIWNCGVQMVSLNYQTPDRHMQVSESLFRKNGRCGYVLKPKCMMDANFDPFDSKTLQNVKPIHITIHIISARHLQKSGRGVASPFVEVEVFGCDYDNGNKYKTGTKADNGLNPVFEESCEFDVLNPELAFLRFVVHDEDMFGDPNFLGQATFPLQCIRTGFRSVPLMNSYSEEMDLAALLVQVEIRYMGECDDVGLYDSIKFLQGKTEQLSTMLRGEQLASQEARIKELELRKCQEKLSQLKEARQQRMDTCKNSWMASNSNR